MSTVPDLGEIAGTLRRLLPAGYTAILFGSRATGKARPGSDWDIGILGPAPLAGDIRQRVREALDEWPTLHDFDVVDLAMVPDSFRNEALRGAVRLL